MKTIRNLFVFELCMMLCLSLAQGAWAEYSSEDIINHGNIYVSFDCSPVDIEITVYDPDIIDEQGELIPIEAQMDGSYLLEEGTYYYDSVYNGIELYDRTRFDLDSEFSGNTHVIAVCAPFPIDEDNDSLLYSDSASFLAPNVGQEDYLWPAEGIYGMSRGFFSGHSGIDILTPDGTEVHATKSGTVYISPMGCTHFSWLSDHDYSCGCNGGAGNYVQLIHDDGSGGSRYLHLRNNTGAAPGTHINQGGYIGISGSSGDSTGPHLHFELLSNGRDYQSRYNNNPVNYNGWHYASNSSTYQTQNIMYVYNPGESIHGSEMSSGAGYTIPNGDYIIALSSDNRYYLDIDGNDYPAANNTNVALWGPRDGNLPVEDTWTLTYSSDGFYSIRQKGTDMALDVENWSTANGTNVQVYASSQKWSISQNSNGSYRIQAKCSGMSLDNANGSLSAGNNIRQWQSNNGAGQQWVFIPVSTNYTVSYNANGGTGAPSSQTITNSNTFIPSSTVPTRSDSSAGSYTVTLNANGGSVSTTSLSAPKTNHYFFLNWNSKADGSGTSYEPGVSCPIDGDLTLYAKWDIVTFLSNVELPTPTRSGYTFKGWATNSSASSGVIGTYCPHSNETLYATWEKSGLASGTWGDLSWMIGNDGCLTITGNGTMKYLGYGSTDAWLAYKDSITKIIINNGVTSVSEFAFGECSKLSSVALPSSMTTIGMGAFYECTNLKKITLPSSVTTIGTSAFGECPFATAGPIGSGCDFEYGWTTAIIQNAFEDFSSLKSVQIPSSVTNIGEWAFHNCSNLTDVYYDGSVSQWSDITIVNTTNTNDPIHKALVHCADNSLISTWGNLSWTLNNSGMLFISGSGPMDEFKILDSNEEETRAWRPYADKIYYVHIFDGVTTIAANAFSNCGNLSFISVPESVTIINGNFSDNTSLKNIYVNRMNPAYTDVDGVLFDKEIKKLHVYPAGRIGSYSIPSGVTQIDAIAFAGCSGLTSVEIPPSMSVISVQAFINCDGLSYVIIPSGVTTIGMMAFYQCSNLKMLMIPESVTTLGSWFDSECNSLTAICYGGTKAQWNSINKEGWGSVSNATVYTLGDFTLPSSLEIIEEEAFAGSSFTCLKVPEKVTSIGPHAFGECPNLRFIYIPKSTTYIDRFAFSDDSDLTILGVSGSTADTYAKQGGYNFIAVQ